MMKGGVCVCVRGAGILGAFPVHFLVVHTQWAIGRTVAPFSILFFPFTAEKLFSLLPCKFHLMSTTAAAKLRTLQREAESPNRKAVGTTSSPPF
jgi:hypothetical protein